MEIQKLIKIATYTFLIACTIVISFAIMEEIINNLNASNSLRVSIGFILMAMILSFTAVSSYLLVSKIEKLIKSKSKSK
jgi:hypothetical protein